MPPDVSEFTGRMATVTGWGRLKYGGGVPSVLQEVQVSAFFKCSFFFTSEDKSLHVLEFKCTRAMHDGENNNKKKLEKFLPKTPFNSRIAHKSFFINFKITNSNNVPLTFFFFFFSLFLFFSHFYVLHVPFRRP